MSDDGYIGGWLVDDEDQQFLATLDDDSAVMGLVGSYSEVTIDPRDVLKVENQRNQGACQGHSLTSACEWCYILESGNKDLQLSRAMGYYETQRIDGIRGDRGSTISGGVKLATNTGICEERLWPYPGAYRNQRPMGWSEITTNAAQYKIQSSYRLESYGAVRAFLGSGQGGISIGISWGSRMSKPVVESFRAGGGGHAVGLFSLSERKDSSGRPYVWMMNSWGAKWGNRGWSEWAPKAVEQMFRHRFTVAIGLSDMPGAKPREFDLDDWKNELKVC